MDYTKKMYSCQCVGEFYGDRCEISNNPCYNLASAGTSLCENGGTCVSLSLTAYKCECTDDFQGEHCELVTTGGTVKVMGIVIAVIVCCGGVGLMLRQLTQNTKKAEQAKKSQKYQMKNKALGGSRPGTSPKKPKSPVRSQKAVSPNRNKGNTQARRRKK